MGFMDSLLGSGETSSESTSTRNPWEPAGDAARDIAGDVGDNYTRARDATAGGSPDDFVAGFNPQQQAAMQRLTDSAWLQPGMDASQGMINQGQGMVNVGQQGYQDIASGKNQIGVDQDIYDSFYNEDLIKGQLDAVGSDIQRNLSEGDLLNIDRNFAGIGGAGSSRAGIAEGVAIRGAQDQMADISANLRSNAHQQANQAALATSAQRQGAQTSAYNNLMQGGMGMQQFGIGSAAQLGQQGATNALNAGSLEQQQRQAEIQGQLEKMKWDTQMPFMAGNQATQALMPWASGFGTTTGTQTNQSNQGLLGQLAPYASMAGAAMSDIRLKDNLLKLSKIGNLDFYKWDWTDVAKVFVGDQPAYGFIAQEVQEIYPDCVSVNENNGYLQIHMDKLNKELEVALV